MDDVSKWKNARKSVNKGLLKNIIKHTDAHNKIQEQNEMWKLWELKKQSQEVKLSSKHENVKGYMRSDVNKLSMSAKKESLKWNRLLVEYEETLNDRWGHSGYKELYPEEFDVTCEDGKSDKGKDKVQRKRSSGDRKKHYKKTKSGERKKEKQSKNNGNALPGKSAEKTDAKVTDHEYHMYKRKNRKNKSQKVSQSGQLQRESSESDSESLKRSRDGSSSKRIVDRDISTKSFQTKKRRKFSSRASY
ncbi:uncharacterized protein NKAPD1-like [Xenia sp. Carnegie-2017]|uniref:uncharacterized protein NKAPD1-like n=1 Tax=Xenia sp. Carnegie-2017 TaxID=2897299 RepID=UPI001F04EFC7|nr:uncharacterized protein NKAPD1-like [Xenia sp. Carnegie-2017]